MLQELGIKRTDDSGVFCERCGADLTQPNALKFTMHADGICFHRNHFECTSCGAQMVQIFQREPDAAAVFGDE